MNKRGNFTTALMIVFYSLIQLAPTLSFADSQTVEMNSVIFLQGFKNPSTERDLICKNLQEAILEWSVSTLETARCIDLKDNQKSGDVVKSEGIGFSINVKKDLSKSQYKMMITRLHPDDDTEPQAVRWEIKMGDRALISIQKLIKQYGQFDININEHKKSLLDVVLDKSSSIKKVGDNQYYDQESMQSLDFMHAYLRYENGGKLHKNYLAGGLELAAVLGASVISYYIPAAGSNPNNIDWDYSVANKPSSLKARLSGDAVRYDDNFFGVNRGHYYAGASYYTIARSAGLNRTEALLTTFASSSFWEYIGEYREVVSINDQINTTFGGFILGETIYQIAKIFKSGRDTQVNRVLKSVFRSPRKMNTWVAKATDTSGITYEDNEDFKPDIWSKLDLAIANNISNNGSSNRSLIFNGEVVSIPMFEEPGEVKEIITDDVTSHLLMEKSANGSSDTFKLFAKTALAAYYNKKLGVTSDGSLEGYNLLIGPAMALEINQQTVNHDDNDPQSDFRGIVHIVGSTLDFTGYHHGIKFRFTMDIYGDFAMIRSLAYDQYSTNHDTTNVASVLKNQDYYYGLGATGEIKVSAETKNFEVGASVAKTSETMTNYRLRFYETQTNELNPTDQVLTEKAWLVYKINKNVKLEFDIESRDRSGQILGANGIDSKELIKSAKLIYIAQ